MINLLIADNQPLTREGVITVLSALKDIHIAGIANDLVELEAKITELKPKVVIIDHHYGDSFSIAAIKSIHTQFDFVQILILSNRLNKNEILDLIDHGIKNYVCKDCEPQELINAVYAAAQGVEFYCKSTTDLLFGEATIPKAEFDTLGLSIRETEIIHLIAEGLANKEIAERLFLSIHTVKTHRKNIIKKLGFTFKNATELISVIGNM